MHRCRVLLGFGVLSVVVVAGLLLLIITRPAARPPGPTSEDVLAGKDFRFTLAQGGWPRGFDVLKVGASGEAIYVFQGENSTWRRAKFRVPANTLEALRRLLANGGFLDLDAEYVNTRVADGTQWALRLDAGGIAKTVWCNNDFPGAATELSQFVHERILPLNRRDLDGAEKVQAADCIQMLKDLPVW